MHGENKIYFKGNPYTRQNYIPSSALKNRSKANYLVELPQGEDYFGSSRKKQYANMHNHSEIRTVGIFQENAPTYHHGTYEVSDIEGAVSNSLVSQAVRNRLKGNSRHHNRNGKASNAYENSNSFFEQTPEPNQYQVQRKQNENRKQSQNYHFQNFNVNKKHIQTEPAEPQSHSPLHSPAHNHLEHEVAFKYNPQYVYIPESTQTQQSKIKDLQQQLFRNQEYRLKEKPKEMENGYESSKGARNHSQKRIQIRDEGPIQDKNKNKRSVQEIKSMWHGDSRKIMLFPHEQIRKLNPTYLSAENYLNFDRGQPKLYYPY